MVKLRALFLPALVLAAVSILAVPAFAVPVYKIDTISTSSDMSSEFVMFKNYLYFAGGTFDSSGTGIELWRTDGTEAGTTLVKDIFPGVLSSYPEYLTVVKDALGNETLYFAASDGVHGKELWKSDGTSAGTVMVKDLTPGAASSDPEDLTAVLGHVVFRIPAYKLGVSDGTDAGTLTWTLFREPHDFFEVNGMFCFWSGVLYRSDFQTDPTVVSPVPIWELVKMGNALYFTSDNGTTFYRSDGTAAGTVKVADMPEGWLGGLLVVAGSRIFFGTWRATATPSWEGLWQFDGAAVSMVSPVSVFSLTAVGDRPFFQADDGVHGRELWTSDGSTARMVKDINPGPGGSDATFYLGNCGGSYPRCTTAVPVGGNVYFFADDGVHGKELWKTDGTEAGTSLVDDLVPGPGSSWVFYGGARAYNDEYLAFGAATELYGDYVLHVLPFRPRFFVEDLSLPEGTAGPSDAVLTVHLDPSSSQDTSVQWATADGTATAGVDYMASAGTLNFPAGTTAQTLSVALIPDATPEVEEKTFHVQLSGSSGPPIGVGLADVNIFNDDGPTISINDITVQETAGTATFTVTRSAATADAVWVLWTTAPGTATQLVDYTTRSGTVIFPAGQLTQPVVVPIVNDTTYEPDEVFYVRLSHPNYGVLGKAEGQCTIISNDLQPTLTVADVTAGEGNAGTSNLTFTVTLSGWSGYTTTVDFATADGTATAGTDYQAQSGTLTIPAGATSGTVVVPIIGDLIDEPNETLTLNLSNPVNATLARAQATGTITDNDTARLSVGNVTVTEGASGTTVPANFTVTLSTPSSWTVTVGYATTPGTTNPATDGVDYTGVSGTLTFPPGTTSLPVPVTVIGDDVDEGTSETFFLDLTNPTNATIQTARGTGTITDDDLARFSVGDVSVVEGNSGTVAATLTVTLGCAYKTDTSVKYYTSNGTALATGATPDFVGISNGSAAGAVLLSFPAGTISQDVTVQVIGDTIKEVNNEYFNLNLTAASGGPAIFDGLAKVTILDDDLLATDRRLSIAPKAVSVTEPSSGETPTAFTVSLIPAASTTPTPSGLPVTVSIVAGGTATAPADYTGVPASLTFAPGTTTQTITAAVQSDTLLESPETLILTLANPTNATIAAKSTTTSGTATLTIYDSVSRDPLGFYTVDPCRVVDTRDPGKGGPNPVAAGTPRTFTIVGGACGIPVTARAVSVNVTVASPTAAGNARVYPGGTGLPSTSNLNYLAGLTRANNAIVLLGSLGDVTVALAPGGTAHVVIDVNGYME
jgi:ELWxxDGT repeat protein